MFLFDDVIMVMDEQGAPHGTMACDNGQTIGSWALIQYKDAILPV